MDQLVTGGDPYIATYKPRSQNMSLCGYAHTYVVTLYIYGQYNKRPLRPTMTLTKTTL